MSKKQSKPEPENFDDIFSEINVFERDFLEAPITVLGVSGRLDKDVSQLGSLVFASEIRKTKAVIVVPTDEKDDAVLELEGLGLAVTDLKPNTNFLVGTTLFVPHGTGTLMIFHDSLQTVIDVIVDQGGDDE